MLGIMYVMASWLVITLAVWFMLPMEERSLGAVASIEFIAVMILLLFVFALT